MGVATKLIVNADDFGMSSAVNNAILLAFKENLISSTSIMANMPGFEQACVLANDHGLHGKIGVHINLIEGRPLTMPIQQCMRFCDENGDFTGSSLRRTFRLSRIETSAIEKEIAAQVMACFDKGIQLTHIDSHHHCHTAWAIGSVVMQVAKQKGVPAVRLNGNYRHRIRLSQKLYKAVYNAKLLAFGLAKTQHSYSLSFALSQQHLPDGIVEIVVHPRFDDTERLFDWELKKELKGLLCPFLQEQMIPYPY